MSAKFEICAIFSLSADEIRLCHPFDLHSTLVFTGPAIEFSSTERAPDPTSIAQAETRCDGRSQHETVRGKTSKLRTPPTRKKCLKILLKQTAKTRQKCLVWRLSWVSRIVRFYFIFRQWNPAKNFRNKNSHRACVLSIKCSDYFI